MSLCKYKSTFYRITHDIGDCSQINYVFTDRQIVPETACLTDTLFIYAL